MHSCCNDTRGNSAPSQWGLAGQKSFGSFCLKEFNQPPEQRLPSHIHEAASLCFVVAGSYVETARGRETACATSSMVFKPAGERHSDRFTREGGRCLLVEIPPRRLESSGTTGSLLERPGLARSTRLASLGWRLRQEFLTDDACSSLAVEGLVLEIVAESARTFVAGKPGVGGEPLWLRRGREMLHDRFRESLTLSQIAAAVQVHPAHFARTFRRHHHTSVGAYVRKLRLEAAARELIESEASIAEIAAGLGFFDQSHFTRLFRQWTGLTPMQARLGAFSGAEAPARHLRP